MDQRLAARMHETETMQKKMVRMVTAEAVAVWLPLGSAMSIDHAKTTEPYPVLAKRFSLTRTGIPTTAMHTTGATTHTMGGTPSRLPGEQRPPEPGRTAERR